MAAAGAPSSEGTCTAKAGLFNVETPTSGEAGAIVLRLRVHTKRLGPPLTFGQCFGDAWTVYLGMKEICHV